MEHRQTPDPGDAQPDPAIPVDPLAQRFGRPRWAGPWLAAIWLFFLVHPLYTGWQARDTVRGVIGMLATVAFAAAYMGVWVRARKLRMRLIENPPLRFVVPYLFHLTLLAAAMIVCLGEPGTASTVYLAVAFVMCLPLRAALPTAGVLAVLTALSGWLSGWDSQIGTAFGICAASLAVLGMRSVIRRNIELFRAHQDNTRLALADERNRFARDLHDILGHSLTVITVKAELARRLLDAGEESATERARAELADLERLSRDALHDVRRAVEGYRELTLPGELARARAALEAAGVTPVLPQSTDAVPTELRELFAWTVREGVTNVIRHSGAGRCEIVLTCDRAEVRDDGGGPGKPADGSGLTGLRERAAAAGAVLTTRALSPGFSLEVAARTVAPS
ncbi:sensor histidine kinase [Nocardioides cheoyonin]|uniref:sensor histidine kinase n=1 Tax=Nocardioides cheoyonin TaxID=3156615 RepID=UPI0032B6086A